MQRPVLVHGGVSVMTDYRGINSLFNQQTVFSACRLSNKIWRPWPGATGEESPSSRRLRRRRALSCPFTILSCIPPPRPARVHSSRVHRERTALRVPRLGRLRLAALDL